jgi:type IV pilus assembly protein PilB
MATVGSNTARSGLARAFVQAGRLRQHDAESLDSLARDTGIGFVEQLISAKKMSALDIAHFVSDTLGYPLLGLGAFDPAQIRRDAIDQKLMAQPPLS